MFEILFIDVVFELFVRIKLFDRKNINILCGLY